MILLDGRAELYQWDTGRELSIDVNCDVVHFANVRFGRSIPVQVSDGKAMIPDELLRASGTLYAWCYIGTAEDGYTIQQTEYEIVQKPKPNDYVFTPTEQITLASVVAQIGDLATLETQAKENLVAAINEANRNGGGGGGENGATFYPNVDKYGNLSWSNDKGLPNPPTVNIKGGKGDKGDTYTLTDADKADIANIATEGISEAIDEIIALQNAYIGGSV